MSFVAGMASRASDLMASEVGVEHFTGFLGKNGHPFNGGVDPLGYFCRGLTRDEAMDRLKSYINSPGRN